MEESVSQMRERMFAAEIKAGKEGKQTAEELANLNPNTEMDFKELTQHEKYTGWRRGLLVARNVEIDADHGVWVDRQNDSENPSLPKKVSAIACSRFTGISDKTVKKYLVAWDLAAADGLVPESADLVPGQPFEFDDETHTPEVWKTYYKPPSEPNDKNAFIALNDTVTSFSSKVNEKWDDAKEAYEDQREVSLETLRENVKGTIDVLNSLLTEINREAKSKKYIDLNQE